MTESHVLLSLFPDNIIRKTNVLGPNEEIVLSAVVLGRNYMVTLHLGRKLYISVNDVRSKGWTNDSAVNIT